MGESKENPIRWVVSLSSACGGKARKLERRTILILGISSYLILICKTDLLLGINPNHEKLVDALESLLYVLVLCLNS